MRLTPLDVARQCVGQTEATGRNDGSFVEAIMRGDKLPWCAGFMLKCFHDSGCSLHDNENDGVEDLDDQRRYYAFRSVATMHEHMFVSGFSVGKNVRPAPNDLVFFDHHVGIVEKFDGHSKAPTVHTIEGNTGNAVARRDYPFGGSAILGYARPWRFNRA